MNDLKEAAEDNELIYNEDDIMRIVHEVKNPMKNLKLLGNKNNHKFCKPG